MTTQSYQFGDLKWIMVHDNQVKPQWSTDPDIGRMKEVVKRVLPLQQEVGITFLAQGAINKVYTICTDNKDIIMRVTLPVDRRWKTLSEVATVEWVRRNTHLPVPEILAHNASCRDNSIGVEWILMSKIPSRPLVDVWKSMDSIAKKQVTHEVAVFFLSMFKKQLHGIGNFYSLPKLKEVDDNDLPEVQRIASMFFFWGDHLSQPVPCGPFSSSRDWLDARLLLHEHDCKSIIARCKNKQDPDEEDAWDARTAERSLAIVDRLKLLLDKSDLFPSSKGGDSEPSMLCHEDLELRNIMVDKAGVLTGVVDWECVSALPVWIACDFPPFLQGNFASEPMRENYANSEDEFWADMLEYNKTWLRTYFLEEMQSLEPSWVKVLEASE